MHLVCAHFDMRSAKYLSGTVHDRVFRTRLFIFFCGLVVKAEPLLPIDFLCYDELRLATITQKLPD